MTWTTDDIPNLDGKRYVVTGGTGGLGFHTALQLGRKGAEVVITARNQSKATATLDKLRAQAPEGRFDVLELDLADLTKVRESAQTALDRFESVDVLINNAGIMATPMGTTADGFETQIGTNHLGHFAFTGLIWPLLRAGQGRVVSVASIAHTGVRGINLDTLTPEGTDRRFSTWQSYGESKLANLLFMRELDRRLRAAGSPVISLAAHPGVSATHLTETGPQSQGFSLTGQLMHVGTKIVAQSAARGAEPTLMAATDPARSGGDYVGPKGFRELRGAPTAGAKMTSAARDDDAAQAVWTSSERATGVTFDPA